MIIISICANKETVAQEKFSKLCMGHTPFQWHSLEADSAGRRNVLFLSLEKVNAMIRAANQKRRVGLLEKCKKGGKWLN